MDDDDLCGVCADECVAEVMMPCQHSLCAACAAALKATHAKRVAAKCPYCSAFVERFEQVTPTNGLDDEAEIANMMKAAEAEAAERAAAEWAAEDTAAAKRLEAEKAAAERAERAASERAAAEKAAAEKAAAEKAAAEKKAAAERAAAEMKKAAEKAAAEKEAAKRAAAAENAGDRIDPHRACDYWWLDADRLRALSPDELQRGLPAFQTLRAGSQSYGDLGLTRQSISPAAACRHKLRNRLVCSHRWETKTNPDPTGQQLSEVVAYLKRNHGIQDVWIDFPCMPQSPDRKMKILISRRCSNTYAGRFSPARCSSSSMPTTTRASGLGTRRFWPCKCAIQS